MKTARIIENKTLRRTPSGLE